MNKFTRSPKTIFAAKCTNERSHQIFHKFSTGIYQLQLKHSKQLFYFSTVSTSRSHKNNSIKKVFRQQSTLPCCFSQLSTLNCQLSTDNCQLSTANCQLPTANSQLSTVNCHQLSVIRFVSISNPVN
ncbi:hypothetical protein [Microcoleus sp. CAWBG58]|uniref:hypothetical protein n=1 Tax=Microcoleus sp. CAWBG58 TaxID=2841651 RepID=UPI0025E15B5A|nr:hypothetical protein [Microcoleus sp. CAWBG58]